ncbi:MAG: calcium/sodium antiporter [Lachnospiraceae bacterium]|nr:calcium/sodium antiporter [Lachnospiraceae bacterium]
MLFNIVLIVAGFYMLIKGADIFVEAASKIATKFNIPQMVIGLTIVAFGTSLPEAAISIKGALSGNVGITIGNVVGSNIMNILLILGVASCLAALPIKKNTLKIEMPFVIFVTVLLLVLGMFGDNLSRIDGVIFIVFMALFMVYLVVSAKKGEADDEEGTEVTEKDTMLKLVILVVAGIICIVIGSNVTVDAASFVATKCGMSNRLIGLTIVAFGTSLPELVTSATAAKRGKVDIAIGNIVGSNIFNILFVVGVCAVITPVAFEAAFIKDTVVAIVAAIMLLLCVVKNKKLTKTGGIIMLVSYAVYFAYILYMNYR